MPYSGKRKLKPIVTYMNKEIEKAKTDKAKVRYSPLTLIGMDCFIELFIVHTHAVLVYMLQEEERRKKYLNEQKAAVKEELWSFTVMARTKAALLICLKLKFNLNILGIHYHSKVWGRKEVSYALRLHVFGWKYSKK